MQKCSVDYTVTDGNGLTSTNTICWTVAETSVIANPDGPVDVSAGGMFDLDLTTNDVDPDMSGPITITLADGQDITAGPVTTADGIILTLNPDGTVNVQVPVGTSAGTYNIEFEVTDSDGDTATSNLEVEVTAFNFFESGDATGADIGATLISPTDDIVILDASGVAAAVIDSDNTYTGSLPSFADITAWATANGRSVDPVTGQLTDLGPNVEVCTVVEDETGIKTSFVNFTNDSIESVVTPGQVGQMNVVTPALGIDIDVDYVSSSPDQQILSTLQPGVVGEVVLSHGTTGGVIDVTATVNSLPAPNPFSGGADDGYVINLRHRNFDDSNATLAVVENTSPGTWQNVDIYTTQFTEGPADTFTLVAGSNASEMTFGWAHNMPAGSGQPTIQFSSGTASAVGVNTSQITIGDNVSGLANPTLIGLQVLRYDGVHRRVCGGETLSIKDRAGADVLVGDTFFP